MKLIELHILQSFPVSCLNRDDVGAPKTAIFGGVTRARISSQCLKRATRELATELSPDLFASSRSRLIVTPIRDALTESGIDDATALEAAKAACDYLAKLDTDKEKTGKLQVKTLMFLSPSEIQTIASRLAEALKTNTGADTRDVGDKEVKVKGKSKADGGLGAVVQKACRDACKQVQLKDAADIAIFGRMVASDHSLTVEGAGMFSHALSTHKADNDVDFFAAVDDLQKHDEAGAGMTGTLEFTSACYYRYIALNLDLLADQDHLKALSPEERRSVVETFLRAAILAVPGARRNSMNAHTAPAYVLGLVKDTGQPIQLVNAFEKPIRGKEGLVAPSIEALRQEHEALKETWGISLAKDVENPGGGAEYAIPAMTLDTFCQRMAAHVQ